MLTRRSLFAGISGLLAFVGLGHKSSVAKEFLSIGDGEKVIQLYLDPMGPGELWRKLSSCAIVENGHTSKVHADELRDLAGALLRAADVTQKQRTFMFQIPQDEAIEGRYGDFLIGFDPPVKGQSPGLYSTNSGTEIGVILETVQETRERAEGQIGERIGMSYDDERRLWYFRDRRIS